MAAKRKLIYYLVLNTVIPGLGQLFMGNWIRGLLMGAAALGCFLGAFLIMAMPIWHNVQMFLSDDGKGGGEMENINLVYFAAAFFALLLVWVWSIIDAAVSLALTASKKPNQEDHSVEDRNV